MKNTFLAVTTVLTLAAAPFCALGASTPPTAPGATSVNVNEAKALFDRGAKFVDVRLEEQAAAQGRIPGSIALEPKFLDADDKLRRAARHDDELVFYCSDIGCANPYYAATAAQKWGYRKVFQMNDGFAAWKAKGLPVAK